MRAKAIDAGDRIAQVKKSVDPPFVSEFDSRADGQVNQPGHLDPGHDSDPNGVIPMRVKKPIDAGKFLLTEPSSP
jgi:hypothetical protein